MGQLHKSISERFEEMQTNLIKIVDKRLNGISNMQLKTYASTLGTHNNHGTPVDKNSSQFKETTEAFNMIVMRAKNEEILEEKEKKERALNIIIHGKQENNTPTR